MRLADLQPRVILLCGIDQPMERQVSPNGRIYAPYRKSVMVDCFVCGKEFRVKASALDAGKGKYCSRACKDESQRKAS